ncbi:MAG: deoxynucleoside kinase [Candidatus Magasanikbacteria bacterium]|nr:deoxynucleoside kinase [Candidatus Magasanikbacteria bacterium]
MFIIVDGLDGSGKSTVIESWKDYLKKEGNGIFDLRAYWKEHGRSPELAEIKAYDFIFSAEPSYSGVGKVIREELIKNGSRYPEFALAEAYSLDRLILYTKLLIPLLKLGRCIIQDRGVSTSLSYQALGKIPIKTLAALPGNALALKYRPDHLILATVKPETALERLEKRHDKRDNVIFEQLAFQKRAAKRFASASYQKLFSARGTRVHELSGELPSAIMKEQAIALLQTILKK